MKYSPYLNLTLRLDPYTWRLEAWKFYLEDTGIRGYYLELGPIELDLTIHRFTKK